MKALVIVTGVSKQGLARVYQHKSLPRLVSIYVGLLKVCVTILMCIEVVINETGLWSSLVRRGLLAEAPRGRRVLSLSICVIVNRVL